MLRNCIILLTVASATATTVSPWAHSWDKVSDVMAMHGAPGNENLTDAAVEFAATHYGWITTNPGCDYPYEEAMHTMARRFKAVNPNVKIGMYWRSDFVKELQDCSGFRQQWLDHPEWRLRADNGSLLKRGEYYHLDYTQPAASEFFAMVLVNVTRAVMDQASGTPIVDYLFIDGDPGLAMWEEYLPGINPKRSAEIVDATYACYTSIQNQFNALGHGRYAILNGMDTQWAAEHHTATGAGSMFDHWTILQFLNTESGPEQGTFNLTAMDAALQLASSPVVQNVTVQVKGWPGPIIQQRDKYPASIQPSPSQFPAFSAARFNSELAMFLLVANEYDQWVYSFFWNFYDYVPGNPTSTVPADFFPQADCPLGEPLGPYSKGDNWTYKREFEWASVFVDLKNRTASTVTFKKC